MIRFCARVARFLTSLTFLVALLVGAPAVLVHIAPLGLPTRVPAWADLVAAATQPDDGQLFIAALSLIAWAGWASFALSAVLEALGRLRGIPAIRLPGLGAQQQLAGALMTSTAVLVVGVAATDPSLAARSPVATAPVALHPDLSADDVAPVASHPAASARERLPTVTVHRGDTLWRLAERHLGAGRRYSEIADLNYGRRQPDGRRLTTSHWLRPGWILRLPADAITEPPPPTRSGTSAPAGGEGHSGAVVVREGDTLWDIAQDRLGDPHRYPEIAALNARHPQPDGRTLTDPDLIRPGWTLALPAKPGTSARDDGTGARGDGARAPAPSSLPPRPSPASTPAPRSTPTAAPAPTPQSPSPRPTAVESTMLAPTRPAPRTSAPAAAVPTRPASAATAPTRPASSATVHPTTRPSTTRPTITGVPATDLTPTTDPAPGIPFSTSTVPTSETSDPGQPSPSTLPPAHDTDVPPIPLLPLGLGGLAAAALVTHLRHRRQRQQQHRPPGERIPQPRPEAARAERRLRTAHQPDAAGRVQAALTDLAAQCRATRRDPPRLAAVLLGPNSVDLVLAEDDETPVTGFQATGPRSWHYEPALPSARRGAAIQGEGTPYPALVTLGIADDVLVLLNLEAIGVLTIQGTPETAAAAQRALAVELVTSPLTQHASVGLGPHLHDLAAVADTTRAAAVDDLSDAVARARAGVPQIHVRDDADVEPQPWSGVTLITIAPDPATAAASSWTLTVQDDGSARLDPLGIDLVAQHLDRDSYERVLNLLASTAAPPRIHLDTTTAPATDPAAVPTAASPTRSSSTPTTSAGPPARVHARVPDAASQDAARGTGAPRVLVLGPVVVQGAHDELVPNRRRRLTELVAYLALHPGASYHQIDEAMWPGARVSSGTRNALVSRARRWLGTTPTGEPYVAVVASDGDYRLHHDATCDWHDLQRLAQPRPDGAQPDPDRLAGALDLVRGRPFLGVDPRDYAWAEADTQEMISTVVDLAHSLSTLRLDAGDHRGAQDAAAQGLLAEPCSELLYRDALRAAAGRGDKAEVARLADRLRAQVERLDPHGALDDETVELLAAVGYRRV